MFGRLFPFAYVEDNAVSTTYSFLTKINIIVSRSAIEDALMSHPDYPTLFSIHDVLNKWEIHNICLEIESNKICNLPVPFIAHLRINKGEIVVVTAVSENTVSYLDFQPGNKQVEKKREDFLDIWSGITILAEAPKEILVIGNSYERERDMTRKRWIPSMVAIFFFLFILYCFQTISFKHSLTLFLPLLLLINFLGCLVTTWLLWFEIDESNPLMKRICSMGKIINCGAVLRSKKAKVTNWLSWSEIGFFYFGGTVFSLVTAPGQPHITIVLAWINLFTLPYVVFSIYYQWKVVGQWCPFCVTVQIIILLEFIVMYVLVWARLGIETGLTLDDLPLEMIACFAFPIFFWLFVKPYILQTMVGIRYQYAFKRLKSNYHVMKSLVSVERTISQDPSELGIVVGNRGASNSVLMVCSPYCGPCATAHAIMEQMLIHNSDLNFRIIFTATTAVSDKRSNPVRHLMALYESQDIFDVREALNDWYVSMKMDYEQFSTKYKLIDRLEIQDEKLSRMSSWCQKMEIKHTPTYFLNGKELPEMYDISDLDAFFRSRDF